MIKKDSELSVRRQCALLGVQRSSVYYKHVTPSEDSQHLKEEIMAAMDELHTRMPYLGTRRLSEKLKRMGYNVGRKLVRSYMEEMGIHAIYPKPNLSRCDFKDGVVPYLLRNKFIGLPNQAWSIDITYIRLYHSHMYLTAIIDWFSRKIVGWELSDTLDTAPVVNALKTAVEQCGCPNIVNSDQGSQFTSHEYKNAIRELGITQSMDGKSRWADNIMIERWFRSLKVEQLYVNEYKTPKELRKLIREYIEDYNAQRPHESLDYKTPDEVFYSAFAAQVA